MRSSSVQSCGILVAAIKAYRPHCKRKLLLVLEVNQIEHEIRVQAKPLQMNHGKEPFPLNIRGMHPVGCLELSHASFGGLKIR